MNNKLNSVNYAPENAKFVLDKGKGWVALLRHSGEEIDIVNAARVSFGKLKTEFDDKDKMLLKFLIDEEHFAPLEHETMTFLVHCPLYVRGQWHRHRTASYNEISRRYTEVDMELYTASQYRGQSTDNKQASIDDEFLKCSDECEKLMQEANDKALETYEKLLSMGVCREQARGILPQNMMTTFYCTMNLRNVLHFLSLRMDKHAQWEIRVYANAIHDILKEIYPTVIEAFDKGLIK
jgi:thymidylate synthase (FAD)